MDIVFYCFITFILTSIGWMIKAIFDLKSDFKSLQKIIEEDVEWECMTM